MDSLLKGLTIIAALVLATSCESADGDGDTESADGSSSSMSASTSPVTTSTMTTGPVNCIAGQENCECLEGNCLGTLQCVEDECLRGPGVDVPEEPIRVIAGLRVPIEAEVEADAFTWEQTGGPSAEVSGVDSTTILVDVPPDASAGDTLTLTLTATLNTLSVSEDVTIEIVEPQFREGLPTVEDLEQLGTPTAIDFRGGELWAVSAEGFVSWFSMDYDEELEQDVATHQGRLDLPGGPMGAFLGQIPGDETNADVLLVANTGNEALEALQLNGGMVTTLADMTIEDMPLGEVRDVIERDEKLYFTNGELGQLLVWDPSPPEVGEDEEPIPAGARVLLDGLSMPSAITLGPEPGVLFVGTTANVMRVPLLGDGSAGDPTVYLDFGDEMDPNLVVDGLLFDRAFNLYVGVPLAGRLLVARYAAGQATEVIRDLDSAGADFNGFAGPHFGESEFGGGTLYYGNASGRVGRVYVGIGP